MGWGTMEKINKRRKLVPERSADSQIREIELKPISAPLDDAAKWKGTACLANCQIYMSRTSFDQITCCCTRTDSTRRSFESVSEQMNGLADTSYLISKQCVVYYLTPRISTCLFFLSIRHTIESVKQTIEAL